MKNRSSKIGFPCQKLEFPRGVTAAHQFLRLQFAEPKFFGSPTELKFFLKFGFGRLNIIFFQRHFFYTTKGFGRFSGHFSVQPAVPALLSFCFSFLPVCIG